MVQSNIIRSRGARLLAIVVAIAVIVVTLLTNATQAQPLAEMQICVVDNISTDGTLAVVEAMTMQNVLRAERDLTVKAVKEIHYLTVD